MMEVEEPVKVEKEGPGHTDLADDLGEVLYVSEPINPDDDPDGYFREIMAKFGDATSLTSDAKSAPQPTEGEEAVKKEQEKEPQEEAPKEKV